MNFTFKPKAKQLILGINGTGKSALFAVLGDLRDFAFTGYRGDQLFTPETRTRWQNLSQQSFELEITGNGGTYLYTLLVETQETKPRSRVIKETLEFNEKPLIYFEKEQVQLFDDNHKRKATYPFDSDRSAIAVVGPRKGNAKLTWFKGWLDRLCCLRINPSNMQAEAKGEREEADYYPEDDLSNFAAWYGYVVHEHTGEAGNLQKVLREIIDGFDSLNLTTTGRSAKSLRAVFQGPLGTDTRRSRRLPLSFDFDELSDGQKSLIGLYTLLQFAIGPESTICIDEPENFLALAEIQPWLMKLNERIEDTGGQVILASHHPELINLLAPQWGVLFSRSGLGPVQAVPYRAEKLGKLAPSEQIARGWERG